MRLLILIISFLVSQFLYCQNNPIIHKDNPEICEWGSLCTVNRGVVNISDTSLGYASHGNDFNGTGIADGSFVSLGDGGSAIIEFTNSIKNGQGIDFAIFENALFHPANQDSMVFAELAFVELSSDGENFVKFPAVSNTQISNQIQDFGTINNNNVYNLAGATPVMYGCGFELDDIADSSGIDINNITHVRIIDVVGSIDPQYASADAQGNLINDPFPTPYSSCGFDLDAVAVLNSNTESSITEIKDLTINIFPNPASNFIYIDNPDIGSNYRIISGTGKICKIGTITKDKIKINELSKGSYILEIFFKNKIKRGRFIK